MSSPQQNRNTSSATSRIELLPRSINNDYSGTRIALGFFVLLTVMTLVRSLIHMVAPDGGAQSIASIPLDAFTENGAAAVIHIFSLWGLSQLIVGIIYVVALVRYRSLIPLMYLLGVVEYAVRLIMSFLKPVHTEGTAPGGVANYVFVPLLILMLVLSLVRRKGPPLSGTEH
jgi:hypothetical protein